MSREIITQYRHGVEGFGWGAAFRIQDVLFRKGSIEPPDPRIEVIGKFDCRLREEATVALFEDTLDYPASLRVSIIYAALADLHERQKISGFRRVARSDTLRVANFLDQIRPERFAGLSSDPVREKKRDKIVFDSWLKIALLTVCLDKLSPEEILELVTKARETKPILDGMKHGRSSIFLNYEREDPPLISISWHLLNSKQRQELFDFTRDFSIGYDLARLQSGFNEFIAVAEPHAVLSQIYLED